MHRAHIHCNAVPFIFVTGQTVAVHPNLLVIACSEVKVWWNRPLYKYFLLNLQ